MRENNVLRFSSTEFPNRTTGPRNLTEKRRYHRQHNHKGRLSHNHYRIRYSKKTNLNLFSQDAPNSFYDLRACYFSNAVEQQTRSNDVAIESNSISKQQQQLAHFFVDEDDPKKINYVQALKSWYLEHHGEVGSVVQDAFGTKVIQNPNSSSSGNSFLENSPSNNESDLVVDGTIRQLFTATFTCPLTNERFEAGRLNGYYDIEDQNCYRRKKSALQAVSAVVLSQKRVDTGGVEDCFGASDIFVGDDQTFRQILQKLYMQRFKTSPTKSQSRILKQDFVGKTRGGTWWTSDFTCPISKTKYDAADLPSVSDSMKMKEAGKVWYRKMSDSVHASASNAIESIDWNAGFQELEERVETHTEADEEWKELLRSLLFWYAEHGSQGLEISINDSFVITEESDYSGHSLWTASFLCPLTGERFDSGTINASDAISSTERDNLIWYTERDAAIQAASQRAYDIFKYRDTGVKDPRFCKEDPDDYSTEAVTETSVVFDLDVGDQDTNGNDHIEYDDDENFVIEIIPQQIIQSSGSQKVSSKTFDIIARTWIDSTAVVPSNKGNQGDEIENFQNAFSERGKTISRALEWTSRQDTKKSKLSGDRTQFDVQGEIGNLKIANAILSSLAECHQRMPFDSQPSGVEDCAVAILESMWSSHSTKPDAQSYAYFLKCLEGDTPSNVAAKAQKIVDAMESGHDENQRPLPKPNDATYGSLIEIRALSGLDTVLESSGINSHSRKKHLCKLSAMAHDPKTFDIDIATKLIDQMKTLSETNSEASLLPDHEIYNAPLRWSCGHLWSRPYSRVIPWDSYNEIYKGGFKSDSGVDAHRNYAEKVEQWIETMKKKALFDHSLAPTIETYESLIQAWVRCGNKESLIRAETIAKSIVSGEYSGIRPRIQTFYPILAAWTYSGCEEGPERVESWIDLLEESVPKLEPRFAFPNVGIMAQNSLQRQILNRLRNPLDVDTTRSETCIFESAKKCSQFLKVSINRYKRSPDFDIQSDVFMFVINAWYNSASSAMLQDNLEETKKCFKEIQNTVDQFDDLLVWLHQVGEITMDGTDPTDLHAQFLRLLNLAPSVYGAQLAALSIMERNVASRDFDKTMHLITIEEKIRRLEELHQFWGDVSGSSDDGTLKINVDSGAISLFPIEDFMGDLFCGSWSDYIDSSLDILEIGSNDSSVGEADFLRLALLIARVTSSTTPAVLDSFAKGRVIEKVVNILENYCEDNQDRETVISTVIQSLNKYYSFTPESKKLRSHSTASMYDANDNFHQEKGLASGTVDTNDKRKARRKRANRSDLRSRSSSYSRSKVSNRPLRGRRPHPRYAEQNE